MIPFFLFLCDWPWYRSPRMAMDIWKAHISAATTLLSQATLIHDRFHLIQYLNKVIDPVRRWEVKSREECKGSGYALLKNERNRTQKQDKIFKVVQESSFQISIAWWLRGEFKAIFGIHSYVEASTYFKLWLESMKEAAVKGVMEIAEMFRCHYKGVCNALCHEQSDARAERLNGKVQEVKTIGRGYRKFKNFRSAIFFFCGGLDLYAQQCR